jgi:hypothetical protein
MKADGSLKSLIQGVSQQPARTRLPGQCTLQSNMSSNPVDGLTRRPPLEWLAELFTSAGDPQFYYFAHGGEDKFIVVAEQEALSVYDLEGNQKTVTEEDDGFAYLDGGKLAFTTLDNLTFIANKTKTCAMVANDFAEFQDYGSITYIRGGNYGRTYEIKINYNDGSPSGTPTVLTASWTSPDGSSVSHGAQISTNNIATQLVTALETADTGNIFTFTRIADIIYINWSGSRTDRFTVAVADGMNGSNILAVNNAVLQTGHLPRYAPHNYHVAVTGSGSQGEDDWYLVFTVTPDANGDVPATGAGFGMAGEWVETVKNKTEYKVDATTMPHVLEYDEDTDEFFFYPGDWAGRQVGDEDSNPDPSFIGRKIQDLGYFQGRLVALAGPSVIMSRTNKPLDFWIESATGSADTDAIDMESTSRGVTNMLRVVPHNRDLVIFADSAQFLVFGRNSLTPKNSSLTLTTSFESNLTAPPVPAGRNIFFAINYGRYTGIREFYTEGSQDINDSRPITQHVLNYILGGVKHLASTSNFDTLLVQADEDLNTLYSYEYIWLDNTKAQSSWSKWVLPNPVAFFFFIESVIYVISKIGNQYMLEKMDINVQDDLEMNYQVKLDRRVSVEGVNTTIVSPIAAMPDIDDMVFVQGEGCPFPGLRVLVDSYDEGTETITLKQDMGGGTVICGQRYLSEYMPTIPFVKDQDGVKVGTGTLIIGKFFINVRESGVVSAEVTSPYREPSEFRFTGRIAGNPNSVVGEAAVTSESFTIPFRDNADYAELRLFTDSHLPFTIMDIEWVGQYNKRGRRIVQGE